MIWRRGVGSPSAVALEPNCEVMAQLGPFLGSAISTVTENYEKRMNDKERELQRAMAAVKAREAELAAAMVEVETGRAAARHPHLLAPAKHSSDPEPAGGFQIRTRFYNPFGLYPSVVHQVIQAWVSYSWLCCPPRKES